MNCLLFNNTSCSLKQMSTIVYKRLKGLSFSSHNAKFWFESYLVANSRRQVFSLTIRFDICSIIIQLKVDRKHTLIPYLC